MAQRPGEISTAKLLRLLRRADVSRHQLHRWHHHGLFPQPRTDGHGRSRDGSTSYYPQRAVVQAAMLSRLIEEDRSLRRAGWALWVLGFPEPGAAWVRADLVAQLEAEERAAREMAQVAGDGSSARAKQRATVWMTGAHLRPEAATAVLDLLIAIGLGEVTPGDYPTQRWGWVHDVAMSQLAPHLMGESDVASPAEMEAEGVRIATYAPHRTTLQFVKDLSDTWLRVLTNEAQLLYEMFRGAQLIHEKRQPESMTDGIMPRAFFIGYLKAYVIGPGGRDALARLRQDLGWTRPPETPLNRLRQELNPKTAAAGPTPPATNQELQ